MTRRVKKAAFIARGLTKGGVGRFITSVLNEWNNRPPADKKIIVYTDVKDFAKKYKRLKIIYIPKAPILFWDNFLLFTQLLKYRPNVVMYTKNVIPLTHILATWKKVVVVYDLAFFYPKLKAYKKLDTFYMKLMTKWTLKFADNIVSISEFTRNEIVKLLKIPKKKITVIKLGVEKKFRKISNKRELKRVIKKFDLNLPFLFYIGSLSPRKNILRLVIAFHKVMNKIPHHLYLISGKSWNNPGVKDYVKKNQLGRRIHLLPYLSENDLIVFYSLATALLYPSIYEGFGLPIIEALACGCPVVTSRNMLFSETSNGRAIPIDPLKISSIKKGILEATKSFKRYQKNDFFKSWSDVARSHSKNLTKYA